LTRLWVTNGSRRHHREFLNGIGCITSPLLRLSRALPEGSQQQLGKLDISAKGPDYRLPSES